MTDAELKLQLAQYKDEMDGVSWYHEMYKKACAAEDRHLAMGLRAIRDDEFTHADFLHDYLRHSSMRDVKEFTDTMPKWNELIEKITWED